MKGFIHSFQSLGTVDGPGVRFVVFMQGCPLRCGCCHNPDTWDFNVGNEFSPQEVLAKIVRFKDYFGDKGGITLSGGEPLCQAQFVKELFCLCHDNGINTCLDTSGYILTEDVKSLLKHTDRVLLDVKYTNEELYRKHVGCEFSKVQEFLTYLNDNNIPTWIRQVVLPTLNDNKDNIESLNRLKEKYRCVEKIELLPFRKICQVKYDNLGLNFPFKDIPTPTKESIESLNSILNN